MWRKVSDHYKELFELTWTMRRQQVSPFWLSQVQFHQESFLPDQSHPLKLILAGFSQVLPGHATYQEQQKLRPNLRVYHQVTQPQKVPNQFWVAFVLFANFAWSRNLSKLRQNFKSRNSIKISVNSGWFFVLFANFAKSRNLYRNTENSDKIPVLCKFCQVTQPVKLKVLKEFRLLLQILPNHATYQENQNFWLSRKLDQCHPLKLIPGGSEEGWWLRKEERTIDRTALGSLQGRENEALPINGCATRATQHTSLFLHLMNHYEMVQQPFFSSSKICLVTQPLGITNTEKNCVFLLFLQNLPGHATSGNDKRWKFRKFWLVTQPIMKTHATYPINSRGFVNQKSLNLLKEEIPTAK